MYNTFVLKQEAWLGKKKHNNIETNIVFHKTLKECPPFDTETLDSVLSFEHDSVTSLREEHF